MRRIIVQRVVTNRSERASGKTRVLFPARRNHHPRLQPTDAFTIILTTPFFARFFPRDPFSLERFFLTPNVFFQSVTTLSLIPATINLFRGVSGPIRRT
jgi:hypothetical protein